MRYVATYDGCDLYVDPGLGSNFVRDVDTWRVMRARLRGVGETPLLWIFTRESMADFLDSIPRAEMLV